MRELMRHSQCLSVLTLVAMTGCGGMFEPRCDDASPAEPIAIQLVVRDSITGASPPGVAATIERAGLPPITLTAGVDSAGAGVQFVFGHGAGAGTYKVTVVATGYKQWERNRVYVPKDECGGIAQWVRLTALLQR